MLRRLYLVHSLFESYGLDKNKAYIFGGTIRDRLMSRQSLDIDIVYCDPGIDFSELLSVIKNKSRVVLFKDIHRFAKIVYLKNSIRVVIDFQQAEDIEDFLTSRDFTVNSMAVSLRNILRFFCVPQKEMIIDINGGYDDLKKSRLRICNERSFQDDPIRILRAAHYSSFLNLQIDEATLKQSEKFIEHLKNESIDKIRENFLSMAFFSPSKFFKALVDLKVDSGLFETSFSSQKLSKIKKLEKFLNKPDINSKEKAALRLAILIAAGINESRIFSNTFSKRLNKRALKYLEKIS
ncbi:MAG: hypothetical protein N2440_04765 [Actinobacteria bacterium]|nr:hypothetical protein [Actinomycetota bacterium]